MKKTVSVIIVLALCVMLFGCSWAPSIPEGVYVGENPYIELTIKHPTTAAPSDMTYEEALATLTIQKIEYNGKVYDALASIQGNVIYFNELLDTPFLQLDDGRYALGDGDLICSCSYYLSNDNTTITLKDSDGEVAYVLNKK